MSDTLSLTAQIVAAHVMKNRVESDPLPELIHSVFRALYQAMAQTTPVATALDRRVPEVKQSPEKLALPPTVRRHGVSPVCCHRLLAGAVCHIVCAQYPAVDG